MRDTQLWNGAPLVQRREQLPCSLLRIRMKDVAGDSAHLAIRLCRRLVLIGCHEFLSNMPLQWATTGTIGISMSTESNFNIHFPLRQEVKDGNISG